MSAPAFDPARLDYVLTNQPPQGPEIVRRFEELRVPAKAFGHAILDLCPASPEQTLAIRKLEEALMWATKAIAVNQDLIRGAIPAGGS